MNEEREHDFFVNLLRPVLLKIVSWINKHYARELSRCKECDSAIVKF
jgi:hypothetical protein